MIVYLFMQHFLHSEAVAGIEYEAQLQTTPLSREFIYYTIMFLSSDIKYLDKLSLRALVVELVII